MALAGVSSNFLGPIIGWTKRPSTSSSALIWRYSCARCGAVISLSMSAARCIVEGRDLGEQYEFEKSMIEEVKTEVLGEKWA